MNVNLYNTRDYENISDWTLGENEPNTKPIKANTKPIKANKMPKQTRSEFIPKGAEITTGELLGILKPGTNFRKAQNEHKFCFNKGL